MTDIPAIERIKRVQIEAVVVRANGSREPLGKVADSSRWWRYGPGRLLSRRRIRKANQKLEGGALP